MVTATGGTASLVRCGREPPLWRYGDLTIRRYRHPAEFDTILELHRTGLAQVGLRPGDGVYYESDLFRVEEIYLADGGEFLVGEQQDQVVAMGGLRRLADGSREIGEMARLRVRPSLQRRGYGYALVLALQERAGELGYTGLCADTTAYQTAALELYRSLRWRQTGRETVNGIVNIYLEKHLEQLEQLEQRPAERSQRRPERQEPQEPPEPPESPEKQG